MHPATPFELEQVEALGRVTMIPGIGSKRFVRDLCRAAAPLTLTARQAAYVAVLAWRYRRQMPSRLVPASEPRMPAAERAPLRAAQTADDATGAGTATGGMD